MDGVAVLLERLNAALAPAVSALPGFHWWDVPPDATAVPAAWCELGAGNRWETDAALYVCSFLVLAAFDHRPSAPTVEAEAAFIDAVLLALQPTPVNALNPVAVSWSPGELDIGSVSYRSVEVSVSLVYSTC